MEKIRAPWRLYSKQANRNEHMITHVDFNTNRLSPLEHAMREAARAYADAAWEVGRSLGALAVRDDPAAAYLGRSPLITLEQVSHFDPTSFDPELRVDVDERINHEVFVALAADLASLRARSLPIESLAQDFQRPCRESADKGTPVEKAIALWLWAQPQIPPSAFETLHGLQIWRAGNFLDDNWRSITMLAVHLVGTKRDEDGWSIMNEQQLASLMVQRPPKLNKSRYEDQKRRRFRGISAGAKALKDIAFGGG